MVVFLTLRLRATSFGRPADLFERGSLVFFEVAAGQHQVAITSDDRQQIIEVVRHTAGQAAHRLHFLRLPDLLFQPDAIAPHLHTPDFALHRGIEPHQIAAGHVIGRARFQHREHVGVPNLPADHDQREVQPHILNLLQSFQRAESVDREIGDGHLRLERQRLAQLLTIGHR